MCSMNQIEQYIGIEVTRFNYTFSPPHLFKTIMALINDMHCDYVNKTIVFLGENRSYKTTLYHYSIYFILNYYQSVHLKKLGNKLYFPFKKLIKAAKVLLNAFGHAKTIKSDNSPRYGEYISLYINRETLALEGGSIKAFLLDRERITCPHENERNYHIFYFLLHTDDNNLLNSLYLKKYPSTYKFLALSNCYSSYTINDAQSFKTTQIAFDKLGFTKEEIESIWKIIASILHLGNIKFIGNGTIDPDSKDQEIIFITDLLKIPVNTFTNLLENLEIQTQTKNMKNVSSFSSHYFRIKHSSYNQIAQQLYTLLLQWLIKKINSKIGPNIKEDKEKETYSSHLMKLSLLRMLGFDNSRNTSFYQFLTNYCNEKLIQMKIDYYFKNFNADYAQQNVTFRYENFYDNQDIINLYESPTLGIFKHINDSNKNERGLLYKNLFELAFKSINIKLGKNVPKSNASPDTFTIFHTEGSVDYSINQITNQNEIEIPFEFYECFLLSKCSTVKYITVLAVNEEDYIMKKHKLESKIKEIRNKNLYSNFTQLITETLQIEINDVIKEIIKTDIHYITCFKSNDKKEEMTIYPTYLLNQIRYTNILNIINFIQNSYSERLAYTDFVKKYSSLVKKPQNLVNEHQYANHILKSNDSKFDLLNNESYEEIIKGGYLEGEKKIFMKASLVSLLDFNLNIVNIKKKYSIAVIIKRLRKILNAKKIVYFMKLIGIIRRFIFHLKLKMKEKKVIIIQSYHRMRIQRLRYLNHKRTTQLIQIKFRKNTTNRYYCEYLNKVICIQAHIRVILAKEKMQKITITQNVIYYLIKRVSGLMNRKKEHFDSITINQFTRGYLIRKKLRSTLSQIRVNYRKKVMNRSAVRIQSNFRMFYAWINYYELKYQTDKIRNYWRMTRDVRSISVLRWAAIYLQIKARQYINKVRAYQVLNNRLIGNEEKVIDQELEEIAQILFTKPNRLNYNNQSKKEPISKYTLPILQPFKEGISFFTKVIDVDIYNPLYQVYPNKWIKEYDKVERYNMKKNTPIQLISIGSTYTIVLNSKGQMFSWGWNYHSQCGSSSQLSFINIQHKHSNHSNNTFSDAQIVNYQPILVPDTSLPLMIKVTCGEDVSFLLDDNNTLYAFGDNERGKLGLNNNDPVFNPTIIPELENRTKEIKSCGEFSFVLTNSDEVYIWPTAIESNNQYYPRLLTIDQNATIEKISCGKQFAMLLSKNGLVFSVGGKNNKGELGTGDYIARTKPTLLTVFAANGEKITNIACGYKHTVCLSSNGKAFVWGSNSNGQLCVDKLECYSSPMQVSFENCFPNRVSVIQIGAGLRSSLFLTDTRHILSSGKMGLRSSTAFPSKIDLKSINNELANEKKYVPIRLMTSWNNSFSIFYITFADIRSCKVTSQKLNWVLRSISSKWINDSSMILRYNDV